MDVQIVGAGAIGLTTAYELVRRGVSVRLLERSAEPERGASWTAAGFLHHRITTQDAYGWLSRTGLERYPSLSEELREQTGVDIGFRPRGGLEVAFTEAKRESLLRFLSFQRRRGLDAEWLEAEELRKVEPSLSPLLCGGTLFARDAQVRPPRLLRALRLAVERWGGEVLTGVEVVALREDAQGRVVGVFSSRGNFDAETTLLAAGCWAGELARRWGLFLPVRPVRGQMLLWEVPAGILSRTVSAEGTSLVQRDDGILLVGTTLEEVGFDAVPTPEGIAELRKGAERTLPLLCGQAPSRAWAGLRPAPARRFPYIAPLRPGLWVATGHFRLGLLMAPSTALLVTAALLEGKTPVPLDDFHPDRDRARVVQSASSLGGKGIGSRPPT